MNKLALLVFLIASLLVKGNSQPNFTNILDCWDGKYNKAYELYEEISVSCAYHFGNPEITSKALQAYKLISDCFMHCDSVMGLNKDNLFDTKIRYIETWILFAWFNQLSCTNSIFTDKQNAEYLEKVLEYRSNGNIDKNDNVRTNYTDEFLERSYFEQVYLAYMHFRYISDEKAVKFGTEYVEYLKVLYGENFILKIFSDDNLLFETGRVYNILKIIPPKVNEDVRIDYFTLFIEMYAEFYLIKLKADAKFELLPTEINDIDFANLYCRNKIDTTCTRYCEYLGRNARSNFKLNNYDSFYYYILKWSDCPHSTAKELWVYLNIGDEIWRIEKTQTHQQEFNKNILLICDMLYDKIISQESVAQEYFRLAEYYLKAGDEVGANRAIKKGKRLDKLGRTNK